MVVPFVRSSAAPRTDNKLIPTPQARRDVHALANLMQQLALIRPEKLAALVAFAQKLVEDAVQH